MSSDTSVNELQASRKSGLQLRHCMTHTRRFKQHLKKKCVHTDVLLYPPWFKIVNETSRE